MGFVADADELERDMGKIIIIITLLKFTIQFKYKYFFPSKSTFDIIPT